jgi:sigma-E factor negative regulatory protein RseA
MGTEPARFLLRRMEREPELARAWSRWHLIRACMAERVPGSPHADPLRIGASGDDAFSERVLAALRVQPQARRHWARYIGGGAIAASVAAAALILSVPQSLSTDAGIASGSDHSAHALASAGTSHAAPSRIVAASAGRDASAPWLDRQPAFLAARPAAVSPVLSSSYLQQAAYAPGAVSVPMLVRDPQQNVDGAPYMILLVPEQNARPQATPQQQH